MLKKPLTPEQIADTPAGRKLDALVHFALYPNQRDTGGAGYYDPEKDQYGQVPHYSTSIADAWVVVERMHALSEAHIINCRWNNFWVSFNLTQLTAAAAAGLICRTALEFMELRQTFQQWKESMQHTYPDWTSYEEVPDEGRANP